MLRQARTDGLLVFQPFSARPEPLEGQRKSLSATCTARPRANTPRVHVSCAHGNDNVKNHAGECVDINELCSLCPFPYGAGGGRCVYRLSEAVCLRKRNGVRLRCGWQRTTSLRNGSSGVERPEELFCLERGDHRRYIFLDRRVDILRIDDLVLSNVDQCRLGRIHRSRWTNTIRTSADTDHRNRQLGRCGVQRVTNG